jgi:hypothetical protein
MTYLVKIWFDEDIDGAAFDCYLTSNSNLTTYIERAGLFEPITAKLIAANAKLRYVDAIKITIHKVTISYSEESLTPS